MKESADIIRAARQQGETHVVLKTMEGNWAIFTVEGCYHVPTTREQLQTIADKLNSAAAA